MNSTPVFSFTRERKLEIVRRILVGREGVARIARELDLDEKLIARWRREYVRDLAPLASCALSAHEAPE